jgi:hypothetical protein
MRLTTRRSPGPLAFPCSYLGTRTLGSSYLGVGMARRIYRQFVYGLSQIGRMQVFTSSGAGTWGAPLRLGSNPEIVTLEFQ